MCDMFLPARGRRAQPTHTHAHTRTHQHANAVARLASKARLLEGLAEAVILWLTSAIEFVVASIANIGLMCCFTLTTLFNVPSGELNGQTEVPFFHAMSSTHETCYVICGIAVTREMVAVSEPDLWHC